MTNYLWGRSFVIIYIGRIERWANPIIRIKFVRFALAIKIKISYLLGDWFYKYTFKY
jgi:hypothetical protein